MYKPFSESCVENQHVILEQLLTLFSQTKTVLEVGSGTGQHAVYFSKHLSHLNWQTSDQLAYHTGIKQWIDESQLKNLRQPLELEVSSSAWPNEKYDAIFSANTCHIMSWINVVDFFTQARKVMNPSGLLVIYGPFNYQQQYTSDSNARFDQWLKSRDPLSGIRHFEEIQALASNTDFSLNQDIEMPVNNRLLCFKYSGN